VFSLIKAGVFGLLLALVTVTVGFQSEGGAQGLGNSTTRAVVAAFVVMALADFVLTALMYGSGGNR
jgi:phospholipid/cholesterol/gamma-HCH transport system permease protein